MSLEVQNIILNSINNDIRQVDMLSNNIVNANTPGFTAEQVFVVSEGNADMPQLRSSINQKSGAVTETNRPLDFALTNDSWFMVEFEGEVFLTKNGRFHKNQEGLLTHHSGALVIGENGYVDLRDGLPEVNADGVIMMASQRQNAFQFAIVDGAAKVTNMADSLIKADAFSTHLGTVQQGAINVSNTSSASDMVRLMELSRHVQSLQKAVYAIDQIQNAGINELGKK